MRLPGRRTPLAMARILPSCGVSRVSTRSASPSSNRDSTMAAVRYVRGAGMRAAYPPPAAMHPSARRLRITVRAPYAVASPVDGAPHRSRGPCRATARTALASNLLTASIMFRVLTIDRPRPPHRRHRGGDGARHRRPPRTSGRPSSTAGSGTTWASTRMRRGASACGRCWGCWPTSRSRASTSGRCPAPRPSRWATTSASSTTTSRTTAPSVAIDRRCGPSPASPRPSTPATPCSRCRGSRSTASRTSASRPARCST